MIETLHFHCRDAGSTPSQGPKIPHASRQGQNKQTPQKPLDALSFPCVLFHFAPSFPFSFFAPFKVHFSPTSCSHPSLSSPRLFQCVPKNISHTRWSRRKGLRGQTSLSNANHHVNLLEVGWPLRAPENVLSEDVFPLCLGSQHLRPEEHCSVHLPPPFKKMLIYLFDCTGS